MKNEAVIAISWHRNAIIDDIIAEESLDKHMRDLLGYTKESKEAS